MVGIERLWRSPAAVVVGLDDDALEVEAPYPPQV
jgi:hypothetical protein